MSVSLDAREILVAGLRGPQNSYRRPRSDRAVSLGERKPGHCRWQEDQQQSPHPDELAKAGRGLETSISRVDQALIAFTDQSAFDHTDDRPECPGPRAGPCSVTHGIVAADGRNHSEPSTRVKFKNSSLVKLGCEGKKN